MLHVARQSVGIAERHLGEDLHELCGQPCPSAVEMSAPRGKGFLLFLHKCATPAVHPWFVAAGGSSFC